MKIADSCWMLSLCDAEHCKYAPISGRASRVGGEPGITKAVLTKIQVGVKDMFTCVCVHCMHVCICAVFVAVFLLRCVSDP